MVEPGRAHVRTWNAHAPALTAAAGGEASASRAGTWPRPAGRVAAGRERQHEAQQAHRPRSCSSWLALPSGWRIRPGRARTHSLDSDGTSLGEELGLSLNHNTHGGYLPLYSIAIASIVKQILGESAKPIGLDHLAFFTLHIVQDQQPH